MGLQRLDGAVMDPMCNDYNKLLVVFDKLSIKALILNPHLLVGVASEWSSSIH